MIHSPSGWILSPAYDLLNVSIVNPEDTEELALTLQGKKSNLKRVHFENFGTNMGLTEKQLQGVFKRFLNRKKDALKWVDSSYLSKNMKGLYIELINQRYDRIYT